MVLCCCGVVLLSCGVCRVGCAFKIFVGASKIPLRRTPLPWTPLRRTAQIFAFFFPSPATIFFLSSLSWGSFREILVVFEGRDNEMCTVQGPGASNNTKIPRKDPQEREEKKKIVTGEGKKARNFGPPTHPSGPHPSGLHLCLPTTEDGRVGGFWPKSNKYL